MFNKLMRGVGAVALTVVGSSAHAAATGAGTGIEAGFAEIGNDLDILLGGAGGFLVVVVSIIIAVTLLATGKGWGAVITSFAVAMILGYGVTALQGISGVTADVEMLAGPAVIMDVHSVNPVPVVSHHSQTSLL